MAPIATPRPPTPVTDAEREALDRVRAGLRLNVAEVATLARCSERAVLRKVKAGAIPARRIGGSLTFAAADVAKWLSIRAGA